MRIDQHVTRDFITSTTNHLQVKSICLLCMRNSTGGGALFLGVALMAAIALGDRARAAAPAPINVSVKAGAPRAWQAGWQVTPYSTVSLRHGNVFTVIPITSWSGRGPAIQMALFHNSKSPVSGLYVAPGSGFNLGAGWTHSFGGQLHFESSTEIWVIADDGTLDKFTKPSSTWVPPAGVHDTLTTITGGYRLTHKDQTYREYDGTTGRLTTIGHPDGNTVTVAYATVASHIRISTVTDASGRVLTFGYNGTTGALTSITAPLGTSTTRQWIIGYGADELTVTDPLSHVTTISTDTNGRIIGVSDENGPTGTIEYDSGTGVLVTDPEPFDDQTVNIEYETDNDGVRRSIYDR